MDSSLSAILEALPAKRPRSRLEPYHELIVELRSRKLTFQDIAELLDERCGVRVTASGIHDFLRRRGRQAETNSNKAPRRAPVQRAGTRPHSEPRDRSTCEDLAAAFVFDPDEPLKLKGS
jgi:transposase